MFTLGRNFLLSLSLLVLINGCASLGPVYIAEPAPAKGEALVYVYRSARFVGSAGSPNVSIDGQVVGELPNNSYFPVKLKPGTHQISLLPWGGGSLGSFYFDVKAGQTYYIRYDTSMSKGVQEDLKKRTEYSGTSQLSSMAGPAFMSSKKEDLGMLANLDTRAQKYSADPGFLCVKPEFAVQDIAKNRIYIKK